MIKRSSKVISSREISFARGPHLSFKENSIRTRSEVGLTMASKHWEAVLEVMPPIAELLT